MQSALTLYVFLGCSALLRGSGSVPIASSNVQQPTPPMPPGYTFTPGVGAHKVHLQSTTWNTARRSCDQEGGHLAIINSAVEAQAVVRLLNESKIESGYVGLHDMFQEDEFLTIHGEPLARTGFNSWRARQPDNYNGGENCVVIFTDGLMGDVRCNGRCHFVCEFPTLQSYALQDLQLPGPTPAPEVVNEIGLPN